MVRRTTIEIDDELLTRAQRALGERTIRGTVEEALRRATEQAGATHAARAEAQRDYLRRLGERVELDVLGTDEMWR